VVSKVLSTLRTYRDIKEWETCEGRREMGVLKDKVDRSFKRTRTPNSEEIEEEILRKQKQKEDVTLTPPLSNISPPSEIIMVYPMIIIKHLKKLLKD
jgi:hypothetical protein